MIVSYRFNKICPSKSSETTVPKLSDKKLDVKLSSQNLYLSLNDEEEEIKEIIVKQSPFVKSWVDIVVKSEVAKSEVAKSEVKSEVAKSEVAKSERISDWGDTADEDFYMTF